MREINFRAWDEKERKMFNVARLDIADGSCYSHLFASPIYDYWNNAKLMQYTGLKDVNGREIYEGDVIQIDFVHPPFGSFVGSVVFREGQWWIDNHYVAISLFDETTEQSVIGNVYENPELLEVME